VFLAFIICYVRTVSGGHSHFNELRVKKLTIKTKDWVEKRKKSIGDGNGSSNDEKCNESNERTSYRLGLIKRGSIIRSRRKQETRNIRNTAWMTQKTGKI
jgi:hypothetical protein